MDAFDDWLAQRTAEGGPAKPPASFSDAMNAAWGAAGLQTPFGVRQPLADAAGELNDAYRRATGVAPNEAAAAAGYAWPDGLPEAQAAIVHTLAERLPDSQAREIAPYSDVGKRAADKAQAIEAEGADVGARTYGLTGNTLAWSAGFARTLVDPTSIAAFAVGVPQTGLLKNWIVREAAANTVFAGATHEVVTPQREELGLPTNSLGQDVLAGAATGVGAGFVGRGLVGLLRAGGWALRAIHDRALGPRGDIVGDSRETPPEGFAPAAALPPAEARPAIEAIEPEDFQAAADAVEGRAAVEAAAGPHYQDQLLLGERLDAEAARVEAAEPPLDFNPAKLAAAPKPAREIELPPVEQESRPAAPGAGAGEAGAAGAAAAPADLPTAPPMVAGLSPDVARFMAKQRADAEAFVKAAPDLEISMPGEKPDEFATVSARKALADADEDAQAANELAACLGVDAQPGEAA